MLVSENRPCSRVVAVLSSFFPYPGSPESEVFRICQGWRVGGEEEKKRRRRMVRRWSMGLPRRRNAEVRSLNSVREGAQATSRLKKNK